ncbi:MAG: bis(5'-nucleosyl)-tetraphosphatase (symmetrical) YqeK [Chloroflexi bacterium]|nr:bis(5'-nucleosyl)-tetraphosphatase (symmetrical) YqeK [Chloroflexota bacterium]
MSPQTDAGQIDAAIESRIRQRVETLPAGLQAHIGRAQDLARELAPFHGVDPHRAALGILAHDVARAMPGPELIARANVFQLPIKPVEEKVPLLLHGPVGAEILRVEDGLAARGDGADLYQAVYWHTTFHPSLVDDMGKVVFLADKLDPNKRKRIPYQPEIMELALEDLDAAILEFLRRQVQSLTAAGKEVHPMMLEARDSLAARVRGTLL